MNDGATLTPPRGSAVAVGLSGGVDSAVAALMLARAGFKVRAVFMRNWEEDGHCPAGEDAVAAAAVADSLGVELTLADFSAQYRDEVFAHFLDECRRGRTPNPDVMCNEKIKFGVFADYCRRELNAAFVATGHYAQTARQDGGIVLKKGEDSAKDQSYFLHRLSQAQLSGAIFPLGGMHKSETRAAAREAGLPNWQRKDSAGICFVGRRDFGAFVEKHLPPKPGPVFTVNGRRVGEHRGLHLFTIGQRKGFGAPPPAPNEGAAEAAWYVAAKDREQNALFIARGAQHPALFRREVEMENAHWIGRAPRKGWVYAARLRHRQTPATCILSRVEDNGEATITFPEPQRAPAAGQYAVIYDGNTCLGGGVISNSAEALRPADSSA